jgi:hypothetical protein
MEPFVGYLSLSIILGLTQVKIYYGFQQNPSKTIIPFRKSEGSVVYGVHWAVSLEIVLWVVAILRCLHPGNKWGYVVVPCDIH